MILRISGGSLLSSGGVVGAEGDEAERVELALMGPSEVLSSSDDVKVGTVVAEVVEANLQTPLEVPLFDSEDGDELVAAGDDHAEPIVLEGCDSQNAG